MLTTLLTKERTLRGTLTNEVVRMSLLHFRIYTLVATS